MMLIACPWCGPRPEVDFVYGEGAVPHRPAEPTNEDDTRWTDYLYFRDNPKGVHRELWFHRAGCHRWFIVERDTVSHVIAAAYPPPDKPTKGSEDDAAG
jgi:sarcosine oxidase, subunit delta